MANRFLLLCIVGCPALATGQGVPQSGPPGDSSSQIGTGPTLNPGAGPSANTALSHPYETGNSFFDALEPHWLRWLFRWTQAHGRRFYNFDGLDAFKAKFTPERWDPVFAISNEPEFSIRSLHAIALAFTNGALTRTVILGLAKAVRQEGIWLVRL